MRQMDLAKSSMSLLGHYEPNIGIEMFLLLEQGILTNMKPKGPENIFRLVPGLSTLPSILIFHI